MKHHRKLHVQSSALSSSIPVFTDWIASILVLKLADHDIGHAKMAPSQPHKSRDWIGRSGRWICGWAVYFEQDIGSQGADEQ